MGSDSGALAVVIGRAGSKGLPGKNARRVADHPMVCYTIRAARDADVVSRVVVSTDCDQIASVAVALADCVIARPPELATDTAPVAPVIRHAVQDVGGDEPIIVILYANVPVRPPGLIDRAVDLLVSTGADSVQSYTQVGKVHPNWMASLGPDGRVIPYAENSIHRRQDLPKLLVLDGGVIAVTRESLLTAPTHDPQAFLGADRRGIETEPGSVVDVDTLRDLEFAEFLLRASTKKAVA